MRAHEIPVPRSRCFQHVWRVRQRAQGDELLLARDLGPAFFAAETMLPPRLVGVGGVEEGLRGDEQGLGCSVEGMCIWRCEFGVVSFAEVGLGQGDCGPAVMGEKVLVGGEDEGEG